MARVTVYRPCYTEFNEFITGHHANDEIWTPTFIRRRMYL